MCIIHIWPLIFLVFRVCLLFVFEFCFVFCAERGCLYFVLVSTWYTCSLSVHVMYIRIRCVLLTTLTLSVVLLLTAVLPKSIFLLAITPAVE